MGGYASHATGHNVPIQIILSTIPSHRLSIKINRKFNEVVDLGNADLTLEDKASKIIKTVE